MTSATQRSPSQCDRILEVLADRKPHGYVEIHQRAGFCRLNSRVAELRKRGHLISCAKTGGDFIYTLVSPLDAPETHSEPVSPTLRADGDSGASSGDRATGEYESEGDNEGAGQLRTRGFHTLRGTNPVAATDPDAARSLFTESQQLLLFQAAA